MEGGPGKRACAVGVTFIEATEHQSQPVDRAAVDPDALSRIKRCYSAELKLEVPNWSRPEELSLESRGYVGDFPLGDDLVVRVKPKVGIQRLFSLIDYAHDLDALKVLEGSTSLDSVSELFEVLS